MICSECVHGLLRKYSQMDGETVCMLDRKVMSLRQFSCNRFKREYVVEEAVVMPAFEIVSEEVKEKVEEVYRKKKGRPLGWRKKAK